MMNFRTEIGQLTYPFDIKYGDKIVLMGSCFSDHIGAKLSKYKFDVLSNPLGIIFNPISIAHAFDYVLHIDQLLSSQLDLRDGLWHHFDFHGRFSGPEKESVLSRIGDKVLATAAYLKKADYLFITFGTANVYCLKESRKIVANNHKFPIDNFDKIRLTTEEIVVTFQNLKNQILKINPNIKFVFTISPVRYIRDGLAENQKSKATLILAADQLVDDLTSFYFPSHEIFNDDLRDYRFYAPDLIHPSAEGVAYVWRIFMDSFFNQSTRLLQKEIERFAKSIAHKPIHEKSKSHQHFLSKLEVELKAFMQHNPTIDFSKELQSLYDKIIRV